MMFKGFGTARFEWQISAFYDIIKVNAISKSMLDLYTSAITVKTPKSKIPCGSLSRRRERR
jgi:hypothetical protein